MLATAMLYLAFLLLFTCLGKSLVAWIRIIRIMGLFLCCFSGSGETKRWILTCSCSPGRPWWYRTIKARGECQGGETIFLKPNSVQCFDKGGMQGTVYKNQVIPWLHFIHTTQWYTAKSSKTKSRDCFICKGFYF